ncbi:MAG: hypothetical protein JWM33_1159 [Caulobacteraceae bacterium]|nr:hypothetical protein [Caulobacteraceae bacterium]
MPLLIKALLAAMISMPAISAAEMPDPAGRTLAGNMAPIDGVARLPVAVVSREYAAGAGVCIIDPPEPCVRSPHGDYFALYRDGDDRWLMRRRGPWTSGYAGEGWVGNAESNWASSIWCPQLNQRVQALADLQPGRSVFGNDVASYTGVSFDRAFNPAGPGNGPDPVSPWWSATERALAGCWSDDPRKPPPSPP